MLDFREEGKKKPNALLTTTDHPSSMVVPKTPDTVKPFISQGYISIDENSTERVPITILHDTGASQSLLAKGVLPLSELSATGESVLIHGVELGFTCVLLNRVFLMLNLVSAPITVGVRPTLPVEGVSLLLGNDLAGEMVMANLCLSSLPCVSDSTNDNSQEIPGLFSACAVTHAMAKQAEKQSELSDDLAKSHVVHLSDTFLAHSGLHDNCVDEQERDVERKKDPCPTKHLIECQQSDPEFIPLPLDTLCKSEAAKVPTCFYMRSDVLMRKWRPPTVSPGEEWQVCHQIVVTKCHREDFLSLTHELPLAGHLGINPLARKSQLTGLKNACTETAKARKLAFNACFYINCHSIKTIKPTGKLFIYYYSL